ncbi:MAG: hypothetical protein ACKOCB_12185 [Planctomycetia bacterium]
MRATIRPLAWIAALGVLLLACAGDASARGGGGGFGGGGRGGFGAGGRAGAAMRAAAARARAGNARGGTGFGMRGNRAGERTAKEWEVLQAIEERKAAIEERRTRLGDLDRKAQQEAFLGQARMERSLVLGKPVSGRPGVAR